ncbi:RNA polymerase sigma factor [compost metagenome]
MYVWNKRDQIQLKSSFEAYAVRSVKNICITHIKRQRDLIIYQGGELPEIAFDPDGTINDERLKAKIYSKLTEALNKLPAERKKLFLMSNVQGLTYAEIAERNNISVNTVKTQIKKAYATLRSQLSENLLIGILLSV